MRIKYSTLYTQRGPTCQGRRVTRIENSFCSSNQEPSGSVEQPQGTLARVRDVLAIGKFGTIPQRPVQSRPAYIISKIYFNYSIW